MSTMPSTPVGPVAKTVGANVRHYRQQRDLTLEAVVEGVEHHGLTLGLTALSKLERGLRDVDVDELFALAQVLDVTRERLLMPSHLAAKQDVLPLLEQLYEAVDRLDEVSLQVARLVGDVRDRLAAEPDGSEVLAAAIAHIELTGDSRFLPDAVRAELEGR